MEKSKIWIIVLLAVGIIGYLSFRPGKEETDWATLDNQITYYYGESCSHCQRVFQFIESNRISEKVPFIKKESSLDAANGREFLAVAEKCQIPEGEAGFPLVYAEGRCYLGEPDVTSFFKQKAGISQ